MFDFSKAKYFCYIIFALLIWSSYGLILKKIEINPVLFTFLTTISGWFFVLIYIKFKHINIKTDSNSYFLLFLLTVLFLVNSFTFFYAYKLTSIPNAVFSHYMAPVFVAVAAPLIIKERLEFSTLLALSVSLIGMTLIFIPRGLNFSIHSNDIIGILLGLISAICYALLIVIVKHLLKNLNYYVVMFYQGGITFIIFLILLPFFYSKINIEHEYIKYIVLIGVTHSFLSPILYLEGLKRVKAQVAGLLGYSEILGSILLGIIFLNEIPPFLTFAGGILIIAAGGYVIYNEKN